MQFAKLVFRVAGIYGLLVLLPQYFGEARVGREFPPAITHPEYFYGFVGLAVVWQLAFLVMSKDLVRYRALMPVAILEKVSFGVPVWILFALGRVNALTVFFGSLDLVLGTLFWIAYTKTASQTKAVR